MRTDGQRLKPYVCRCSQGEDGHEGRDMEEAGFKREAVNSSQSSEKPGREGMTLSTGLNKRKVIGHFYKDSSPEKYRRKPDEIGRAHV